MIFLRLLILSCCIHFATPLLAGAINRDSIKIEALLAIDSGYYTTLGERKKFYKKAHRLFFNYGYEVKWMEVAAKTVRILQLAHSKIGGAFANTNSEIRTFLSEGNKAILDDVLVKVRNLWKEQRILTGTQALKWDAQMLSDEQNLIDPYYENLSQESQAILDHNLKRWISVNLLGNPKFNGYILEQEARWVFGMTKMGYSVNKSMMPKPEGDWHGVTLKLGKKCSRKMSEVIAYKLD